jgi:hypothetical protein
VPRDGSEALSRHDARRAWRLRELLHPEAVGRFDAHTVGARRQLTVLYHEVLAWDRGGPEEITELVPPAEATGRGRHARGG